MDIRIRQIALTDRTAAALTWVLAEALDASRERLGGLAIEDARAEIADLADLVRLMDETSGDLGVRRRTAKNSEEAERLDRSLALQNEIRGRLAGLQSALAAMERDTRTPAGEPNSRESIEAEALAAYQAVAGQVVLMSEVECYDATGSSVTAHCEPPAVGRVFRHAPENVGRNVLRWTDAEHCDPAYDVEILEPHPAFAGLRPSWVYGTCRSTDGHVEPAAFRLADAAMQRAYAGARGLAEDEAAPAAAPAP